MSADKRGALSIVLHTHMPYVEGFGTWPFGEEWLWEAIATSYLPLLDVLELAPFTLSITPVLADQLEADGMADRFLAFIDQVRVETHARDAADLRNQGLGTEAEEIERSANDYMLARKKMEQIDGNLLGALAPFVTSTSSATHAILPLLASDQLVRAQIETGIASHKRRFGDPRWFWLPECAYDDALDDALLESGVESVCIDLTDLYGYGSAEHHYPRTKSSGLRLIPIDRATFELAWSDGGYPSKPAYRDSHRLTHFHHRPYANSGQPYDRDAARQQTHVDAAEFVAAVIDRLEASRAATGRPGLSVATFDTEFFGHWWFEGIEWLRAVAQEADRQGLEIVNLVGAVERFDAAPFEGAVGSSSWGTPRDLTTWDGERTADMVWQARKAELDLVTDWPDVSPRSVRELLALQSSDWAFLETRATAGPYPRERLAGHLAEFNQALSDLQCPESLRNLAPEISLRA